MMSPNRVSSGFDEIFIFSSSESSDSEFLLQEDIKTSGNHINKQWEAIERTLYQEPGQQVTDPELLKECKLWREAFPHFRVKGTRIELNRPENKAEENDKNIQTLQNHFSLKKIEEKRKSIKKKVVGTLVERLIAKFGSEKGGNTNLERDYTKGVQITEIDDDSAEDTSRVLSGNNDLKRVENSNFPAPVVTKKESYFERGKSPRKGFISPVDQSLTSEQMEKKLYEIFDSWEEDSKTATKLLETAESAKPRKIVNSKKENLILKNSAKTTAERFNPRKSIPISDSLSNVAKPFEITKKIDKKYEGLINKIMERKYNGLHESRHCRTLSSSVWEKKSYQEPLQKFRIASGFDDRVKNTSMPRLNKFTNNWLNRSELNAYHHMSGDQVLQAKANKTLERKPSSSFYTGNMSQCEIDEKFLEDLKREMAFNCKRPPRKSGVVEEISLRRPKPFRPTPEMTIKSSSGDFSKKNKNEIKGGQQKKGLEMEIKESNVKSRVKHNNSNGNRGNKMNGNQNSLLPPIESGIICTELTGRPKIGLKNPSKRH